MLGAQELPSRGAVARGAPRVEAGRQMRGERAADHPRGSERGGRTLREIADALNARGIATARGGQWYAQSVANVLARA
jgi:hypothetical protein